MARKPITYERLIKRDRKYKGFRFLFTLVLLLAGILFIRHVDARLNEYEVNQPVNVLKRFIQALESDTSESDLVNYFDSADQEVLYSLSAVSKELPLSFKEVIQSQKDEQHYNLLSGSEIVASVKLKQRKAGIGENYDRWDLISVTQAISSERVALDLLKTFQNGDFSYIIENTDPSLFPTESVSDLSAFLASLTEGKEITLSEGTAPSANEKAFVYLLGGEPFFTVYMEKDASNSSVWNLSGNKVHFIKHTVYTAKIPAEMTLYVNGAAAEKSLIKDTTQSEHAGRVSENVVNPIDLTVNHYEIAFAFGAPEFSIKNASGNDVPFALQETEVVPVLTDAVMLPEFSSLETNILDATGKIADFFVGEAEMRHIQKYVEKDSKAYDIFEEYNMWKSLNAGSTKMESCEIKSMTKLGDNCFVVKVEGLFKAYYTATNVIDYPLDYTLYYHSVNDNWLIYDFISK